MKIIDLLVKIANKEELPNKIKVNYGKINEYYKYNSDIKCYETYDEAAVLTIVSVYNLNNEVEIIEEIEKPKKIEPLNPISLEEFKTMNPSERYHATMIEYDKIEELRNAVNYLLEKSDKDE